MASQPDKKHLLEICANSYQSAKNAQDGGADRIELCQNLEQGGITPSYGLIKRCVDTLTIPIHVLIRPRPDNFVYTDDEFQIMLDDIAMCVRLGVAGVVVGVLCADHTIDTGRTSQLVEAANPLLVTFHMAIEDCPDRDTALEQIITAGCGRVLTTGDTHQTIINRFSSISRLLKRADGRIEIMLGKGITASEIELFLRNTKVTSFHASAKSAKFRDPDAKHSQFFVEELESDIHEIRLLADKFHATSK